MDLTNGFMDFKKHTWLFQVVTFLKHSAPVDMCNIIETMLMDFSGILTMMKGKLSLLSESLI